VVDSVAFHSVKEHLRRSTRLKDVSRDALAERVELEFAPILPCATLSTLSRSERRLCATL